MQRNPSVFTNAIDQSLSGHPKAGVVIVDEKIEDILIWTGKSQCFTKMRFDTLQIFFK